MIEKHTFLLVHGSAFENREGNASCHYAVPIDCTITQLDPSGVSLMLEYSIDNWSRKVVIPVSKRLIDKLTAAYYYSKERLLWLEVDDNGKER